MNVSETAENGVAVAGGSKEPEVDASNEEGGPCKIVVLKGNGITDADIQKLEDAGITTVEALSCYPKKNLIKIKGISEEKAEKLMTACLRHLKLGFTSAANVLKERADIIFITTGCKNLDKILAGGIETGSVSEVYGESSSGKTQFCHQLAVMCQLPVDMGGGEGKCLYISSENSFRPERLMAIASHFKLNTEDVLDNVNHCKAMNSEHMRKALIDARALLMTSRHALVVVDSATGYFRTDYSGRGELAERQMTLGKFIRYLRDMAHEFGSAIIITNQVVADVSMSAMFGPAQPKPVGGDTLGHATHMRIQLRKGRGEKRLMKVVNSPFIPEIEEAFLITGNGLEDVTEG